MRRPILLLAAALVTTPLPAQQQTGGITPGAATYSARVEFPGQQQTQDIGMRRITIADSMVGGTHAWVVVNEMKMAGQPAVDSVLMRAGDLRPISRRASIGGSTLNVAIADSVLRGRLKTPRGTVSISLRPGERAFLNYYALRAALGEWPLAAGWRGTASALELVGRSEFTPLELAVEGEERIRVPAGEFDCWVVHVTGSGGIDERWWVSKAGQRVVRTREPVGSQGAIMQLDLVSAAPAP